MAAEGYAGRYARALLDALQGQDAEGADRELASFEAAWKESAPLRSVFLDPSIKAAKKIEILDRLNEKLEMSRPVRNFVAVILRHERMDGFEAILGEFRRLLRGERGVVKAEWTSARALGEDERQAVEARIRELTGRALQAEFHEDPTLLGGARLRIGSTIYDGSVRGRLDALREKLAAR